MQINQNRGRRHELTIHLTDLVDHYLQTELSDNADWYSHATRVVYQQFLKRWIRPHWADINIRDVRTVAVEHWLRRLQRADGNPLAARGASRFARSRKRGISRLQADFAEFLPCTTGC